MNTAAVEFETLSPASDRHTSSKAHGKHKNHGSSRVHSSTTAHRAWTGLRYVLLVFFSVLVLTPLYALLVLSLIHI